jgi:hypothetical protein
VGKAEAYVARSTSSPNMKAGLRPAACIADAVDKWRISELVQEGQGVLIVGLWRPKTIHSAQRIEFDLHGGTYPKDISA